MRRKALYILLFFCCCFTTGSAQQKTDSLQNIVNGNASVTSRISALEELADIYSTKNFETAIVFADAGLKLSLSAKDSNAAGTLNNIKGKSFYLKGNYDSAAFFYSTALNFLHHVNDQKARAEVLNNSGRLYRKLKDYNKALSMYNEAFDIYFAANDDDGMATIYNESGVVFEYMGDFNEAITRYSKSLELRKKLKDVLGESYSISFIGAIYVKQQKYTEAALYLQQALQLRRTLKDSFSTALSITDLADMYGAKKDYQKAFAYYDSGNAMAMQLKYPQLLSENYFKLSQLWELKGDASQSLAWYKKYTSVKDSLLSDKKFAQIEELNTKYQTEKKEEQLMMQRNELRQKNFLLALISIIFLLAIVLAFSLYHKRQIRHRLQLQVEVMKQQDIATKAIIDAEENERRRIAADLHDGLGQMMSAAKMNLSAFEQRIPFENEEQKVSFENIIKLVDESCREIRNVSHQIMPNALLKSSLAGAVKEFIDKIDSKVIKVALHAEGLNDPIDKNTESVLYRVIQECVNNVLKHSGANYLDIALIKDADGISITIEDNGKGFVESDPNHKTGLGLKNIISRVSYLKGTIDFDSTPGNGTLVAIHIPVNR